MRNRVVVWLLFFHDFICADVMLFEHPAAVGCITCCVADGVADDV
jgi:hypothetical protein